MDFINDGKFNPTTAGYIQKILDALMNVRGMDVKTFKMTKNKNFLIVSYIFVCQWENSKFTSAIRTYFNLQCAGEDFEN